MELKERIDAFVKLGELITKLIDNKNDTDKNAIDFQHLLETVKSSNEWFTHESLTYSLTSIAENLKIDNIQNWIKRYPSIQNKIGQKRVGLVTAGNIPLVGFHDLLSVLMAGHEIVIKLSSKDDKLMKGIVELLKNINHGFDNLISFENNQLKKFDAIIATGSNNSAKYFEYYFGKYPNIIRKNRNSLAILTGDETKEDLDLLADDILLYYGLGCRNVSKIYIPDNYNIDKLFESVYKYHEYSNHNKFANNYTYNKSIYLMNKAPFWENGFMIMKEDSGLTSPISVVFIERYQDIEKVKENIEAQRDQIQCVVAKKGIVEGSVLFGESQKPNLWDYADNVDTLQFLLSL